MVCGRALFCRLSGRNKIFNREHVLGPFLKTIGKEYRQCALTRQLSVHIKINEDYVLFALDLRGLKALEGNIKVMQRIRAFNIRFIESLLTFCVGHCNGEVFVRPSVAKRNLVFDRVGWRDLNEVDGDDRGCKHGMTAQQKNEQSNGSCHTNAGLV